MLLWELCSTVKRVLEANASIVLWPASYKLPPGQESSAGDLRQSRGGEGGSDHNDNNSVNSNNNDKHIL